jgi:hypothetical protein
MGKFRRTPYVRWIRGQANLRHKGSFDKVCKYLEIAKGDGYEIIAGGKGMS